MSERLTETAHGNAPLHSAYKPDARASDLWVTDSDDELIGETVTINRPLNEIAALLGNMAALQPVFGADPPFVFEGFGEDALVWRTDVDGLVLSGRVVLCEAPAGRGTELSLQVATESRSAIGKLVDRLKGNDPRVRYHRVLRRLKQLAETGEITTTEPGRAAPRS